MPAHSRNCWTRWRRDCALVSRKANPRPQSKKRYRRDEGRRSLQGTAAAGRDVCRLLWKLNGLYETRHGRRDKRLPAKPGRPAKASAGRERSERTEKDRGARVDL